jgi:phage recombination protein Bet
MTTTTSLAQITDGDYSREKVELIKRTIAVGATDDELQLFLYAAKKTGLDPLTRQIYAVKRWNQQAGREVMTVQTGIDGYRLIADRTGKLAGISDPAFDTEDEAFPRKATVTVKKLLDNGTIADFTATARWGEYVQTGKDKKTGEPYVTGMWKKMPFLMLGKCSEALALRKAFPADLSGVYTAEEMAQADNDQQRDAVYAEVEKQKAQHAPVSYPTVDASEAVTEPIPPELEWSYQKASGVLICRIMGVKKMKKRKGEGDVITIKMNNSIDGKDLIYYFHKSHQQLLLDSGGKIVKLMVEQKGDFVNVTDVMEVAGEKVETEPVLGVKPFTDSETQVRLLASTMDFDEDDFALLMKLAGGSWDKALEALQAEKVRRESEVLA